MSSAPKTKKAKRVPTPITISKKRDRAMVLEVGADVVVPAGLRTTVLPSAPVYARHQLTDDAVVPSVVSSAECRPWARTLEGARS